jgi:hypothetical protein
VTSAPRGQSELLKIERHRRIGQAAGLGWHSRQISAQTAYVFYATPLSPPVEFDLIGAFALSEPEGWALIDQALSVVGVERLGASALVREICEELPPDFDDE